NLAMVVIKVGGTTQAINDYYLSTDGSVNTSLSGLPGELANDDPQGSLQAALIVGPLYGTLQQNSDGSFVYMPDANFFEGTDSFIYRLTNGGDASNFAMVTIRRPDITVDAPTVTYGDDATVTVTVTFPGLGPAAGNVSLSAANATVATPGTATLDVT